MPQEFHVVRCFQCSMYQVDIKKNSTNKWTCKICNAKQSLKQSLFEGSSSECREKVKQLSELKFQNENEQDQIRLQIATENENNCDQENEHTQEHIPENTEPQVNKWAKYLDNSDNDF